MKLSQLKQVKKNSKKRLGLGHGSGRGKTAGRGTKGQNARSNRSLSFEGGALPMIKRLPFLRGKGKNKSLQAKPIAINVEQLEGLKKGSMVDMKLLIANKIVDEKIAKRSGVKILGNGKISTPLTIKLPITKSALKKVEKAGGSVVV